jgi:hypothetical protein
MYFDHAPKLEALESRTLLASVTMLIHGHQGTTNGWVTSAADAIARRAGEKQASQYVLKVGKVSGDLGIKSITLEHGPGLRKSSTGDIVIKLDWTDLDNGDYSTTEVGEAVAKYMLRSHGSMPALASLPLHLIGHSRGGSMVSAISRYLGGAGVWVDQNTFLDPVAVEDFFGFGYDDLPLRVYSNVVFADDYWRSDGDLFDIDPDGSAIDGAHNVDLNDTVQKKHFISAHMGVTAYYHGTIDLGAKFNRDSPIADEWYGNTDSKPARDKTGYLFSQLVGGSRPRDGLSPAFGGTGDRRDPGKGLPQWSNVGDVRSSGGRVFSVGERIKLKLKVQDRDSGSMLTLFLDRDRNPYNDNYARTLRKVDLSQFNDVKAINLSGSSGGVSAGNYYVCAKITDAAGHTRFGYSRRITLESSTAAASVGSAPAPVKLKPAASIVTDVVDLVL